MKVKVFISDGATSSPAITQPVFLLPLSQPKLMAKDLLDLVASHFNLKEKEYFGISYTDET